MMKATVLVLAMAWQAAAGVAAAADPPRTAAAPATAETIDQCVFGRLKKLGIEPAAGCSDAVFVRRIYLDVIGTLPTAAEASAFLADTDPRKRNAMVERLLGRDEFADYWAMRWCQLLRVKSEFPINLWPNAVQAYHRWIRTCVKDNLPYDRFVRELLTASGSNFRKPQVNFYRAVPARTPQGIAQAVALTFMGMRADQWPRQRLDEMGVFFSRVGYKITAEWKEEIVFFDLGRTTATPTAVLPDGTRVNLGPMQDPRAVFADWLVKPDNPWFARHLANLTWCRLMGCGIIHEPDDIRPDNPPRNPELLDLLARELATARFDPKHLFRLILNSRTYQLSAGPAETGPDATAEFACYPVRRLEAEVLIDAINQITGSTEKYISRIPEPFTYMPEEQRAIALADASITSSFLELFGRCPRNTGLESEQRGGPSTAAQQLHLLNSSHIRTKLENSTTLRPILGLTDPRTLAESLYLTVLSRHPTAAELAVVREYAGTAGTRAGRDLLWALVNTTEFQTRH